MTSRELRAEKKRLLAELIERLEHGAQFETSAGLEATRQLIAEFRRRASITTPEPAPDQPPLPGIGLWQIAFPEGFRDGQPAVATPFRSSWR